MEIITGVERRRRWRLEDKLRIVAEARRPGACFADVARRHEVSRGLLWSWRDQVGRGALAPEPVPVFVPLRVTAEPTTDGTAPPAAAAAQPEPDGDTGAGRIEIALPDGTVVRVPETIGLPALRRILSALRG